MTRGGTWLHLDEAVVARLRRRETELLRLYGITDTWLADALMKLCRLARAEDTSIDQSAYSYDTRLVWYLVPEIAKRLGYRRLLTQEIDWELRSLSNYELRLRTGFTLANASRSRPGESWSLLTHEVCNGNPVVFGIDRLCAGVLEDREDLITRRTREICGYRNSRYNGVWAPTAMRTDAALA